MKLSLVTAILFASIFLCNYSSLSAAERQAIPVLCYHQIREVKSGDSKSAQVFITPPAVFRSHMRMLRDNGYHVIRPDEFLNYLEGTIKLPPKPILLTFDDGTYGQYENAVPILNIYRFKAVFFIMTVTIGKPGYMNAAIIRKLSDEGHAIGCHTWDHHDVRFYKEADWKKQLVEPTQKLESITAQPVKYFAYPFGLWNENAVIHLNAEGFAAAFQLGNKKVSTAYTHTLRRILVCGSWTSKQLELAIKNSFQ